MLLAIGTKVKLIHTGDIGTVYELMDHGLVSVLLPDGDVIPVAPSSLEVIQPDHPPLVKAKVVPGKQKVEALPLQPADVDNQYLILKPRGLQLAFDPVMNAEGTPDYYRLYLINDTAHNFLYQLVLTVAGQPIWDTKSRLGPRTMIEAGALRYHELNQQPAVQVDVWRLLPDGKGTGRRLSRNLKIKAGQFFKKLTMAPYLNRSAHLYALFTDKELSEKVQSPQQAPPKEPLRNYTQRQERKRPQVWRNLQEMPHEVWELAAFQPEIDLHIEKLVADPATVPAQSILSTQIKHLDAYLQRAIRLGVERVFVIHGVGEGKLRDAVARKLRDMPEVLEFKNEFHPRYGYGATEVIF
ncbi:MAG: Smr/MutS family protein [Lewinella sp.]|nr:Smr/MutS family protein [Lewinella sp.]